MTGNGRSLRGTAVAIALLAIAGVIGAGSANAAAPDLLLRIPKLGITSGQAAGQLNNPRHLAANRLNGHLFISEVANARISEYTAWGDFVKAFGWDVAPGSVNEEQEVAVSATAGQYTLSFDASSTADLSFDANSGEIEAALNALPSIAAGGGSVSVSGGFAEGIGIFVVRFDGGPLAATDISPLSGADGTNPLSGGTPTSGVTVATRANGMTGGVGLEACTAASGCKAGVGGGEPGQFVLPTGMALDAGGYVYVFDKENNRVQKFNQEGEFLLMFGGDVNKTKVEEGAPDAAQNRCPVVPGDVCQAGTSGTDPGQFFNSQSLGNYLAVGPSGTIFVGDKGRIQEFNPDGTFLSEIVLSEALTGKTVKALDIDANGNLYVALIVPPTQIEPNVLKLNPAGGVVQTFPVKAPVGLALDATGNLYVANGRTNFGPPNFSAGKEIVGFESSGVPIPEMEEGDNFGAPECEVFLGCAPNDTNHDLVGVATNICEDSAEPGNLYGLRFKGSPKSYVSVYGTPPIGCEPPPRQAPSIEAQSVLAVDTEGALLRARINPRFWADTTYYVQYGTGECSKGGCNKTQPLPPGATLTDKLINVGVATKGVFLSGLEEGTTYHYRFVAQSGGGGPVLGVDGEVGSDGSEGTFRTFRNSTAEPCSANEQFRNGPGAQLPDCRAYEMVSPLDKNNGDILAGNNLTGANTALFQATESGEQLTYSALRTFGGAEGAPFTAQYVASRDPATGWSSKPINAPRTTQVLDPAGTLQNEFRIFSPDLCQAWFRHDSEPPLAPGAVEDYANIYRVDLCGDGGYEALTLAKPEVEPPELLQTPGEYFPLEPQGASASGAEAIYVANGRLTDDAPVLNKAGGKDRQLYLHAGGVVHFVCWLPNGEASKLPCVAGGGIDDYGTGHDANLDHAISADGSRVFWTAYASGTGGIGRIYLRENPADEQSVLGGEECIEAGKACTLAVSKAAETLSGTTASRFWGAAANGSKVIFATGKDLYEFEVDGEKTTLIADAVEGVLGLSEDASHVYFVSTKVLSGEEENSEEQKAEAGEPNLYLYEQGTGTSFLMTISEEDLILGNRFSPVSVRPFFRASRVSADGRHAVFMSSVSPTPTDYDNTDVNSGEPATEVYLYHANGKELRCISCNPSGAQPAGRGGVAENPRIAAQVPTWERSLYRSRVISEGGNRVFFESYEALVPRDTNGALDVYQWEAAGAGSCDAADAGFAPDSGGCVELISSGASPRESLFVDASPSGDDVFITTLSSLVPEDYGLVDVYDARVGGGFPSPSPPKPPCEGEACQSSPAPPADPTPASATFSGPGKSKVKGGGKTRRCNKRRRAGSRPTRKTRCGKKHKAQRGQRSAAR